MNVGSETLYATSVAIEGRAILLTGRSGSGKSDLALRLIDRGATLISDDYTVLTRVDDTLIATSPSRIAGKIEVRGVGIVEMDYGSGAPVSLILDLDAPVERLPDEPAERIFAGLAVPVLPLSPWEASAAIKVVLALKAFGLATERYGVSTSSQAHIAGLRPVRRG